jgi:hypothetical protein
MIVILDTNALHGDVHAKGQGLGTLFSACESGLLRDTTVWTPTAVVGELVRQFGERTGRMRKVLGEIKHDLSSFGLERPDVPVSDEARVAAYRVALAERLTATNRLVAPHPPGLGRVIDWAAGHSGPIKALQDPPVKKGQRDLRAFMKPETKPIFGVVDGAVWMTVVEAAKRGRVALITSNTRDFADPSEPEAPCAGLAEELRNAGCDPIRVKIYSRVIDFTRDHVAPAADALQRANDFLADTGKLEAFTTEVSDAIEWFPIQPDAGWAPVDIDDVTLSAFDPREVHLERADLAPHGVFITAWVSGLATVELGIRKGDAMQIPEDSPIHVYDWDWNESMAMAEAELPAQLLIEAILHNDGQLGISVEDVQLDL